LNPAKVRLLERKEYLELQRATTADAATRFQLEKQIEETLADIAKLDSLALPPERPLIPPPLDVHPAVATIFVGREEELVRMADALLGPAPRPVALVGMAGVGKSYLAERFAFEHRERFPGGIFRMVLDPEKPPASAEPLLRELTDRLQVSSQPVQSLARRIQHRLSELRTLLHIENADGQEGGRAANALLQIVRGCPVVVSGRLQSLGTEASGHWEHIAVPLLDEERALAQLDQELGHSGDHIPSGERRRLVQNLFFLPLAVHLAAGYLRNRLSVDGFLAELRAVGFDLGPVDPADPILVARAGRELIASTFRTSLTLLSRQLGPTRANDFLPRLLDLGFAPASGFGESLGAALCDMKPLDFEALIFHACQLSLLDPLPGQGRRSSAWRMHPLLAEVLKLEAGERGRERIQQRKKEWFTRRFFNQHPNAWQEVGEEIEALAAWLTEVPAAERVAVREAGGLYAQRIGPFQAWLSFCEVALNQTQNLTAGQRAGFLWTIGKVALKLGALDRALAAADELLELSRAAGFERNAALTSGLRADILQARGEWEEALRMREEELRVHTELGKQGHRAVALGKIADVMLARGEVKQSLRIRREQLQLFRQEGDQREYAATWGKIADALAARGKRKAAMWIRRTRQLRIYEALGEERLRAFTWGQIADLLADSWKLDESLRIRREEELPVYKRLGDLRLVAAAQGKIADAMAEQGDLGEAIRCYRDEVLPVYQRLNAERDLAIDRVYFSLLLLRRGTPEDYKEASHLLHLALKTTEAMRLKEDAQWIRDVLADHGLTIDRIGPRPN